MVHEWDDELAGEAMPGGPVVLSWDAMANDPAMNVVIHEFAHKLDMLSGAADGVPPLHAGMSRKAWLAAFERSLRGLLRRGGARTRKPGSIRMPPSTLPSSSR